ncbi:phosphate ABC transporter substrate-binding protein PstS [Arcticibacter tournemirensis]|uniref:Phosphate-binding protein n=1 Tax=Arcticibacter tournemirensis TaxID=699437 RepID=A0A4Q0ME56_9SPHI|nr:phosphate ABC transporter substrate-binding protein PstS [Arcticibacter tournemirensis]RXF71249.1 phosphate ABC transporter substrate-binding protein PstS [Arcticibacter tournemirensis]
MKSRKGEFLNIAGFVFVLLPAFLISCNSGNDKATGLIGAGSSFVYPLFSTMFSEYHNQYRMQVNYQSIGSGGGILQLTNKTIDFGATDAPVNEEQEKNLEVPVLHVPVCIGATVISYHIPGVKDTLNLSPEVLADIFLGKIKNWNHPSLKKDNPGISLPNRMITVVHRSDGSGTSFIFTDYLTKVSNEWKERVGRGTAVNWPAGLGGKGNEGVAGLIKHSPGSIGYVELSYALENKMGVARIKNLAGRYIAPTISSIAAAADIELPADAKASITQTPAPEGYPLSSFSWALIYKEQKYKGRSREKAEELLRLLWWCIHEGQQYNEPLHYAPLHGQALKVTEKILQSATYDGQSLSAVINP